MEIILSLSMVIAGVLGFALLAAFFGKSLINFLSWPIHHSRQWRKEAVEAEAIILHIEQTGLYINNKPQVKLQVQVKPGRGRNFVTEINEIGDEETLLLKAGATVRVKFNPKNYKELFLVKAA